MNHGPALLWTRLNYGPAGTGPVEPRTVRCVGIRERLRLPPPANGFSWASNMDTDTRPACSIGDAMVVSGGHARVDCCIGGGSTRLRLGGKGTEPAHLHATVLGGGGQRIPA